MEMKIQFGNIKFKFFYDGKLDGMFSKSNMDFFNKMYEKVPLDTMNYYKDFNKTFMENMKRAYDGNIADNAATMPANGHDIYNYVARYGLANFHLQAVMKLDGCLDFKKLSKAVRLSVDVQPVFGCRFIENEPPYWRRLDNPDETMFCSLEETENPDEAVQRFLESPLDMDNDPMVKVRLIRSGTHDTVCIKVNHACSDGTGTKEYVQLLSEIYSFIDQDIGVFIPKPGKRGRKDQDRLFSELGIADPETEWISGSEITRATWPFPWKQVQSDVTRIVVCRLSQGQLGEMTRYSKARGATINDLILTAYYRAMPEIGQPVYDEPMEIPVTIDLRRFLPDHKTEAIRNFSGSEFTKITMVPNETFDETLSRVVPMMNEIKNSRPGLQSAIGLERVERMSFTETLSYYKVVSQWPQYCCDKCAPVLSNLGIVANPLIKFGRKAVTDAYIVPPVVRAPGFLLMISTYNDIMTLAAGFYEGSMQREDAERLLNKIKDELVEGCRQ